SSRAARAGLVQQQPEAASGEHGESRTGSDDGVESEVLGVERDRPRHVVHDVTNIDSFILHSSASKVGFRFEGRRAPRRQHRMRWHCRRPRYWMKLTSPSAGFWNVVGHRRVAATPEILRGAHPRERAEVADHVGLIAVSAVQREAGPPWWAVERRDPVFGAVEAPQAG